MNHPWDALPEDFIAQVRKIVAQKKQEEVLRTFCIKKPTTFRTNTLKTTTQELKKGLKARGITYKDVDWYEDAFVLEGEQGQLTDTDLYKEGYFYVQSLSSMIPPLVLDPQPGETILDLTAAPGSKTTQIAALMKNEGQIIANDRSKIRLYKLSANLKIQGVTNVKTTYMKGEGLWKKFPEVFDKTLVDVPCSLEGKFLTSYPKSYSNWSLKKVKELAQLQKHLLRSGVSATRPGGTIVYSTCTMEPQENEEVVAWVLEKEKGALVLEEEKRIIPTFEMEAFYVAKLRKVSSTI